MWLQRSDELQDLSRKCEGDIFLTIDLMVALIKQVADVMGGPVLHYFGTRKYVARVTK